MKEQIKYNVFVPTLWNKRKNKMYSFLNYGTNEKNQMYLSLTSGTNEEKVDVFIPQLSMI